MSNVSLSIIARMLDAVWARLNYVIIGFAKESTRPKTFIICFIIKLSLFTPNYSVSIIGNF